MSPESKKPERVTGRNEKDAIMVLSGAPTGREVDTLEASLDRFTAERGWPKGTVAVGPSSLIVDIPHRLDVPSGIGSTPNATALTANNGTAQALA